MQLIRRVVAGMAIGLLLALPGTALAQSDAKPAGVQAAAPAATAKAENKWYKDKDTWVALTGIVALLGTAVPLLARSLESVSLVSRRKKELQHIEDLADLMQKIRKEEVLSQQTLADVSAQIEAEIRTAVDQLSRNRERRVEAQKVQLKAQERKVVQAQSSLSLTRRLLLLFMPHGVGAWLAHGMAALYATVSIVTAFTYTPAQGDQDLLLGSLIIVACAWGFAQFARRRWERTTQADLAALAASASAAPASGG